MGQGDSARDFDPSESTRFFNFLNKNRGWGYVPWCVHDYALPTTAYVAESKTKTIRVVYYAFPGYHAVYQDENGMHPVFSARIPTQRLSAG